MASKSRIQVIDWLKKIDISVDKVIDVGAGTNLAKNYATVKCREYHTLDNDPATNPKWTYDMNKDLCCVWLREMLEEYDVAFCIETLEHLYNPVVACENLNKILKPGGILYLTVCYIYPHHGYNDYLRYTDFGLKILLEKAQFENIEITPRVATIGQRAIMDFFAAERMHSVNLRDDYPKGVPIGYMVKCQKK
jgi:SAM-dependent methyltransferase